MVKQFPNERRIKSGPYRKKRYGLSSCYRNVRFCVFIGL